MPEPAPRPARVDAPRPVTNWHRVGVWLARISAAHLVLWGIEAVVGAYLGGGVGGRSDWYALWFAIVTLGGHELLARRLLTGRGEIGAPIVFLTELGLFGTAIGFMLWYGTLDAMTLDGVMAASHVLTLLLGTIVGLRLLFGLWFGRG